MSFAWVILMQSKFHNCLIVKEYLQKDNEKISLKISCVCNEMEILYVFFFHTMKSLNAEALSSLVDFSSIKLYSNFCIKT